MAIMGHGEPSMEALIEVLTCELASRILADADDPFLVNVTDAELLAYARAELMSMAIDADEQAVDWALPVPYPLATGSREGFKDTRQVKFAVQTGASRRSRAPTHRVPTPVPESWTNGSRHLLYPTAGELEETDAARPSQGSRRARVSVRGMRSGVDGTAERPNEDAATLSVARASSLADLRLAHSVRVVQGGQRPAAATPRNNNTDTQRPPSPHSTPQSTLSGTAGRCPRPTTPHRPRQVPLAPSHLPPPPPQEPRASIAGSAPFVPLGPTGATRGVETGDTSPSPRQDKRLALGQVAQAQRRTAPGVLAQAVSSVGPQQTATPRSSVRAAAVAAGVDPRPLGIPSQAQRRSSMNSPGRSTAQPQPAQRGTVVHKSVSPTRGNAANRRVGSPRQAAELHRGLSPGTAARLGTESGHFVSEERDVPRVLPRARQLPQQDIEVFESVQMQTRSVGNTLRAHTPAVVPKDVAAVVTKVHQARARKAAAAAATAAGAGSRTYTLHSIAAGDEVGGIVTHTSWVGPFVNIGAEVDGFVDPLSLPEDLKLKAGDLIYGLRVELVDSEKPKLLLDGKNARTITFRPI